VAYVNASFQKLIDGLDELDGGIGSNAFLGLKLLLCYCIRIVYLKNRFYNFIMQS
jgi:hypothetical protein